MNRQSVYRLSEQVTLPPIGSCVFEENNKLKVTGYEEIFGQMHIKYTSKNGYGICYLEVWNGKGDKDYAKTRDIRVWRQ